MRRQHLSPDRICHLICDTSSWRCRGAHALPGIHSPFGGLNNGGDIKITRSDTAALDQSRLVLLNSLHARLPSFRGEDMNIVAAKRSVSSAIIATTLIGLGLISGCGGRGGESPTAGTPATAEQPPPQVVEPLPSSNTVTTTISSSGGVVSLPERVSVTIPEGTLTSGSAITLSMIQSDDLDREFSDATTSLHLLDWEDQDVAVTGFEADPPTPTEIQVKLKVSEALAAKVGPGTMLAGIVWILDEVDGDEESSESLASSEVLPSTYDAGTRELTVLVSSIYLSDIDPATHSPGSLKQRLTIRVGLFDTKTESATSAVAGESGNVTLAAVGVSGDSNPRCGTAEWTSPLSDYRSVASFGEIRKNKAIGHGGLDLVTRDKGDKVVTGRPTVAVADGYIETVKSEACPIPRKGKPLRCFDVKNPGYALTLALTNGDRVAYRHLLPGGVQLDGLKDEPDILRLWQDDGTKKYKVKAGQVLALTGKSGNVDAHLHLEYFPKVDGSVTSQRNPLCKLVKLDVTPSSVAVKVGDTMKLNTKLIDRAGNEYRIRRQITPEVFLSATAVPRPPGEFPVRSRSVMVSIEKSVSNPSIAAFNPTFIEPSQVDSNNGVEELKALQPGTETLLFKPTFIWTRTLREVPFGDVKMVPITVAEPSNGAFYQGIMMSSSSEGSRANTFPLGPTHGLAFRLGSDGLNFRQEQEFGCIGATASIQPNVGHSFSFTLASGDPYATTVPARVTYTITAVSSGRIDGTFRVESSSPAGLYVEKGTWAAGARATPFPKCLPPTRSEGVDSRGQPTTKTPSFYCPSYDSRGADPWGCSYRELSGVARPNDWPTSP